MLLGVGQTYAGRYRIVRKLGEGAMGAVYEAEHILIHRRVALKVLLPTVAERHGARSRFEREAQAAGRIGSPHIVEVLDMGDLADGEGTTARFLVMELLEGETLSERVQTRGRLLPEEAAPLACQILAGLGAAHAADIIHRDLKPANVFLVRGRSGGDFVKILDFGVSKFNVGDDMSATSPGAALGTPYYMSPEQAKGSQRVDARSDLYSVGVILYECLTGQVPFDAGTFNELIFRIVLESPPPLESFVPEADPAFVAIVRKAMAREPAERFQSAREMHDALSQWLSQVTGKPVAPGVVPWDGVGPFVPTASGPSLPRGPGTEMFENAQTLLHMPRKRRTLGTVALGVALLGVVAGASSLLLLGGRSNDSGSAASAQASAAPPETVAAVSPPDAPAPPSTASAAPSATPAASPAPPPIAAPPKPSPKRPAPAPAVPPHRRTVSSEL